MEKEHRRIILDNICELIKLTNYDLLMKKCLERKIMFPIMKSEIEVKFLTKKFVFCILYNSFKSFQKLQIGAETKHKMLFEKITHRGPNAFQGLVEICRGNFVEAANLLQRKSSRTIPIPNSDDDDDDGTISLRGKRSEERKHKRKNRDKQNDAQSCEQHH